ncbi:MAG: acyl-CoA thioesterase [Flavobacteriia bacterium]|nr:acyl-CoA thioesterase [Flavobacteriia bacterium]
MNYSYTYSTSLRVRYGETDQMGYCYYGNYAQYFEVGRVETMRSLSWPYKRIEEIGIMLPVTEFNIKYKFPAKYDDLLTVVTYIKQVKGVRIFFEYEIYNEENNLICSGNTTLVFIDFKTRFPTAAPKQFLESLSIYKLPDHDSGK